MTNEIDAIREEIASLREEIAWTRDGRLPRADAIARIGPAVDALAAKFTGEIIPANLASLPDPGNLIESWLTGQIYSKAMPASMHLGPLLAWLHGDALKARLIRALEESGYISGVPLEDRPGRLAALESQLRGLEVEEERLVEAGEAAGLEVYRRADVNWTVVLGFDPDGEDGELSAHNSTPGQFIGPAVAAPATNQAPTQGSFLGAVL